MTTTNANNYTVTIADAGSAHTLAYPNTPGPPNADTPTGKLSAALTVLQAATAEPTGFAAFVAAGTWTITITQP